MSYLKKQKRTNAAFQALIKVSGWASSFLVLLIVLFLFTEGLSLFTESPVSGGLKVAVHPSNPVRELSPDEFRGLLDGKIENWSSIENGPDAEVFALSTGNLEKVLKRQGVVKKRAEEAIGANFERLPNVLDSIMQAKPGIMLVFQPRFFPENAQHVDVGDIRIGEFVAGSDWEPAESPAPIFGALPLLWGTVLVTIGAIILALILGPPVAIYMAELADDRTRGILKPVIELLAGIPSVVYGFIGLVVIVPWIRETFALDSGSTALAGSILLAIIALPTIISVSEDAIRAVPRDQKMASLSLGATHWQTISRVVIPHAKSGILAAIILGVGRIVGETMVVLMVTGNSPQLVGFDFLESVRTMSAAIAAEMGEAPQGGLHYKALFAVGCLLFLMTFAINFVGELIKERQKVKV